MTFSESSADRGQGGLRRERHSGLRFKYPGLCYIVVKWQSSNFVQDSNVLSRKKKKGERTQIHIFTSASLAHRRKEWWRGGWEASLCSKHPR